MNRDAGETQLPGVAAEVRPEGCVCHDTSLDSVLKIVGKDLGLDANDIEEVRARLLVNQITTAPALEAAVREQRLCGLFHPCVTDAIAARVSGRVLPMFDLDEFSETRLKVKNPAKFANGAVFVHRIAPVPGTRKGRIAVTWAFDLDVETTTVAELLQHLEVLVGDVPVDRMRLVFNGFTMSTTSSLRSYDVTPGDTLFLYTLRDPQAQVTFMCAPPAVPTHLVPAPLPVGILPTTVPAPRSSLPAPVTVLPSPVACAPVPGLSVSPVPATNPGEPYDSSFPRQTVPSVSAAPVGAFLAKPPSGGAHLLAPQIIAPQLAPAVLPSVGGAVLTPAVCQPVYGCVAPGAQLAVGAGGYGGDTCLVTQPVDRRVETCKCGSYTAFRYAPPVPPVTTCGTCPMELQSAGGRE